MNATEVKLDNQYILYDTQYIENPKLPVFDPSVWEKNNAVTGVAEGRGTTYFIDFNDLSFVLRHYCRGGLVAKVSADKYVWSGIDNTRAWREWRMLATMRDAGLPVPVPVAARVVRSGLFYAADILTLRIPEVETLTTVLSREPLPLRQWQDLGKTIGTFHQAGVWHADLNANNILIGSNDEIHIIDFDKCRFRQPQAKWQMANLNRLKRSLQKLAALHNGFNFDNNNWHTLLKGYGVEP